MKNLSARLIHCISLLVVIVVVAASSSSNSQQNNNPKPANGGQSSVQDLSLRMTTTSKTMNYYKHAVFSDVDGTLVHYPKSLQQGGGGAPAAADSESNVDTTDDDMIYLPPSKTGTRGVISARTLQLCSQLRHGGKTTTSTLESDTQSLSISNTEEERVSNGGVPFVLISGMRTTTLFQRLPYLPRADAYVSESGGRIFYPHPIISNNDECDSTVDVEGQVQGLTIRPVSYAGISPSDAAPFTLVEDMHWRNQISQQNAAGSDGYNNDTSIDQRKGKLWDFARSLKKEGYVLDASGYATAYRINRKHQTASKELASSGFDDFIEKCAKNNEGFIPKGLGCSTNLGCVDIYPSMSGKKHCAEYLVKRFLQHHGEEEGNTSQSTTTISLKTHAFCLCDDDNDVEMALACRAAYLPSVTSESIQMLVDSPSQGGGKLVVTENEAEGIVESLSTEAALDMVVRECQQP